MDKKTNMPHDDFSVEEILQEARLLREQQGEENAIPATEEDAKPAPERARALPVDETPQTAAQQPVKEPVHRPIERKEPEPAKKMEEPAITAPKTERMLKDTPKADPIQWTETQEPEEEEPRKLSWAERRAEKKRMKEERRRLKKQSGVFTSEEEDIYYGLQLKPLEEYKQQYEQTLQSNSGKSGTEKEKAGSSMKQPGKPVGSPVGDKTGSIFSYLFDSTDEEMDEEIAARFETLHQERKQRLEETARRTGAFQVHENTIEIQFPKRSPEAVSNAANPQKPVEKIGTASQTAAAGKPDEPAQKVEPAAQKMVKKQEPVKPVAEHKVQTPPILDGFPVGDETFEFPAMGSFARPVQRKGAEKTVTAPDLPVEGETFEFPAVGGYAVPPQIEDTHPIEPLQPTEPTKPTEPVQPTEPKTPVKPRKAPKQTPEQPVELPATPVSTPEAPVHTEPGTPTVIPEMPVSPDMQPVVTPIRGEESASADTYSQEKPLQPRPGGKVRRADYRPAGVTPVHVVELHDYAEVILKEAKTYPKVSTKLHTTPLPKLEEMADDQKEEEIAQTVAEKKTVEEAPAPEWEPIVPEAERRTAERFSQKDEPQRQEDKEEIVPPLPKKKKKFSIMGEEEPDNDPQEDLPEEPDELDDYQRPSDAPSVTHELGSSLRELTLRLAVTGIVTVLLLALGVLGEMTSLLPEAIRFTLPTQTYLILNLIFLGIASLLCWVTIFNGIKSMVSLQANSDSGVAVAAVAALIQSVALLFAPESVASSSVHAYAALASAALFLNTAGKFSLIKRIRHNFRFVASPDQKYAVQYFDDHNTALQMAKGCVADTPAIAYQNKAGFLKHFLSLSYENDPSDQSSHIIAPIGAILSLVLCIVYYVLNQDVIGAITVFAAATCISVPMMNMLSVNLPLARLSKLATRCGAMVVGYPAVEHFSTANAVVLDAKDLFPKGTVILNGIKTFGGQRIDDAIVDATALMCATGGPLSDLFDQIIKSHHDMLPKIENLSYEDDKGVVGWVSGRRILVGNRDLIKAYGIEPPSRDYEEKYLLGGKQVVYLASGGDLVAMFVLSYNSDRRRAAELRRMEDNGISLIVRTCDPNITPRLLAQVFDLDEHGVRVLPERLGKEYMDLVEEPDERVDALLATKGRPTAMMRMLTACVRQRSNISVAIALQTVAVVLGFLLVAFLACYSGLKQLSTAALLLFELFWLVAVLIVPRLRKP